MIRWLRMSSIWPPYRNVNAPSAIPRQWIAEITFSWFGAKRCSLWQIFQKHTRTFFHTTTRQEVLSWKIFCFMGFRQWIRLLIYSFSLRNRRQQDRAKMEIYTLQCPISLITAFIFISPQFRQNLSRTNFVQGNVNHVCCLTRSTANEPPVIDHIICLFACN